MVLLNSPKLSFYLLSVSPQLSFINNCLFTPLLLKYVDHCLIAWTIMYRKIMGKEIFNHTVYDISVPDIWHLTAAAMIIKLCTFRSLRFTVGWPLRKSCAHTGIFLSVSGHPAVKRKLRKVPNVRSNDCSLLGDNNTQFGIPLWVCYRRSVCVIPLIPPPPRLIYTLS